MGHNGGAPRLVTRDPDSVDDRECHILHVDMDAFFAAVELRRHPELIDRPMMVAGDQRGVVLSANYEARAHGVRSGMPTSAARRSCPGIAVVPPDHHAYRVVSTQIMAVFGQFTPLVEPVSVDEAFLDVAGAHRVAGRPVVIAAQLRSRLSKELGLTASVGAASTKFVAKLASGLAKPDGLLVVPPEQVLTLLRPLPVRALWGVGPRTAESLESLGMSTVGEVADADRAALVRRLGVAGATFHDLANGIDPRRVVPDAEELSIGSEQTFARDISDRNLLNRQLLALAERTARRARTAGRAGRTVGLKVRFADFTTVQRSVTLDTATNMAGTIFGSAIELLRRAAPAGRQIRLLGVRLEGLENADRVTEQLELDTVEPRSAWNAAEGALDRVMARFGERAMTRASLIDPARVVGTSAAGKKPPLEVPATDSYS